MQSLCLLLMAVAAGAACSPVARDTGDAGGRAIVWAEEIYPGYAWQDLGNGIYLHTRTDPFAGPVDGNSTVIINDEDVFVVDTHINPAAARAVAAKIGDITDKPVTHVVNTHWHDDHTNGNHAFKQAYPDARIVSHSTTLSALQREWQPMEEQRIQAYGAVDHGHLIAFADSLEAEDPQRAIGLRTYAGYLEALTPELGSMELVYPDLPIEDSLAFVRGERRIVVQWVGRGNTEGDVVVWLPDDGVLIAGDVVVAPVPYAFDSPMLDWIATLERIESMQPSTLIPGHGGMQDGTDYVQQVRMLLTQTVDAVRDARAAGTALDELTSAVDLSEQESLFTGGTASGQHAWNAYFLSPALKSAWVSLGYPTPEVDR